MRSPGDNVDREMQRAKEFPHLEEAKQAEEELPANKNLLFFLEKKNSTIHLGNKSMISNNQRREH